MQRYNPKDIEPKWQKTWQDSGIYKAVDFDEKPKYVMLTEFPYPSGAGIHIGHAREYTYGDMIARYKRMQGYNVLYPMGFDEFGLPTENFAIKNKVTPQSATETNVANFQKQLEALGYSFDWSRSVNTSDPEYYKWTQWLFLQFYKEGLAYQAKIAINWCPHCKTGLANEEVVNGRHERCDTLVEKKFLKQWLLKITEYADRLIEGLKDVDYPSRIADQQINWIGKSKGAEITFPLATDERYMLLHGYEGSPTSDYHKWLAGNLSDSNVVVPTLPNSANSNVAEQTKYILDTQTFTEDTVIVAHSLGSVVAMKALEQLDTPIKRLVLVAGFSEAGFADGKQRPFEATFDWQFDFEKIKANVKDIVIVRDTTDTIVPAERADTLQKQLGGTVHDIVAQDPHVCGAEEPALLEIIRPQVRVFTTRADTIFSGAFLVLAPEHKLVDALTTDEHRAAVHTYIAATKAKSDIERQDTAKKKTGAFTGSYAINPANDEKIPIWIGDFVLANYGTGAIFGDIHDERDFEFIQKFNIPARVTVVPEDPKEAKKVIAKEYAFTKEGVLIDSGDFSGLKSAEARDKIIDWLEAKDLAVAKTNYRLRDWVFSRQHYWGEPIPVIHCAKHGAVAVPDDQLPVVLPKVDHYEPTDTGESPLAAITDWVNTTCPECGGPAKRETDTMPNWAGSSWYYLRYFDAKNDHAFADREKMEYWKDVDLYLGGMEHTTLHLLYSRFWHQFFYDQGLVPTPEPYAARRGQGIIQATDGTKMSKSKGNVVNPTDIIESGYGADALRMAIAFLAPFDQTTPWSPEAVAGTHRVLQRTWTLIGEYNEADGGTADSPELERVIHKAIKKVSQDLDTLGFNTAIAAIMECVNDLYGIKKDGFTASEWQWALESLVQLLAPFAPHVAEELWEQLGHTTSVHLTEWPTFDESKLIQDTIKIVIQVNGKVRGDIQIATDATEDEVIATAKANERVAEYLDGKELRKTIYVPGKLVSFVI